MRIGIDASRAFVGERTGIEEYSYQVIKHFAYRQASLTDKIDGHQVILYVKKNQKIDFKLPADWKIKVIHFPYLWTQLGLSLEMLFYPVDILFVPAHTVPCIHPRNTIVTVHGLEYEFCPKAYSFWERIYMRWSIKNSCCWAKKIIAVSENTKKDLINLYKVPDNKIKVVYEGYDTISNLNPPVGGQSLKPYFLFIGRLEERKNINGIIEAFKILKEKYEVPHRLVLAGRGGYGYENSKLKVQNSKFRNDIVLAGFITDQEKWEFIKNAEVLFFPAFYEGFGLPILEAQSVGIPVITSNVSSMPEAAGEGALIVDPQEPEEIAEAAFRLINDKNLRSDIIQKGLENVKRFSWEKCASETAELLKG